MSSIQRRELLKQASFDHRPVKAVAIAQQLNADSLRYPAASYYAYFPTHSGYPIHPEIKGDPRRETVDACRQAGLKTIACVMLRYPFDAMYFDGPYQGMQNAREYCHCKHCQAAHQKRYGRPVPSQAAKLSREGTLVRDSKPCTPRPA